MFDVWVSACNLFAMWRGENGGRYKDSRPSLAILRGCTSNSQRTVSLMSPPEQKTNSCASPNLSQEHNHRPSAATQVRHRKCLSTILPMVSADPDDLI